VEGTIGAFLRSTLLFAGLSEGDLAALARLAARVPVPAGGHIFSEGGEARGFYVVESGTVKVYKLSAGGREQVLHHVGRGEAFGEVALFAGRTYPASALALTPASLLFFPKTAFLEAIAANPSLALNMIATLALRLRSFAALVEALTLKDASARLAAYLLDLSRAQASPKVSLPVAKAELAASLGIAQETLSRTLKRLREAGLLRVSGRRITLLDAAGLEEIAQEPEKWNPETTEP
jgi:CRP/FNR family transcriptional regulator